MAKHLELDMSAILLTVVIFLFASVLLNVAYMIKHNKKNKEKYLLNQYLTILDVTSPKDKMKLLIFWQNTVRSWADREDNLH